VFAVSSPAETRLDRAGEKCYLRKMKGFFVKIKAWQLLILMFFLFFLPFLVGYFWLFLRLGNGSGKNFPSVFMIISLRAAGSSILLSATFYFLWQWYIAHYLFELLPDRMDVDFEKYKRVLIFEYIIAIVWGLFFFSGVILVLAALMVIKPYMFLIFFFLTMIFVLYSISSRIHSFPYRAVVALLRQITYKAVKLEWKSSFFRFQVLAQLQNDVRKVFLKYGEKRSTVLQRSQVN
jgi:hypothetical protein